MTTNNKGDYEFVNNAHNEAAGLAIQCPGCGKSSFLQFSGTKTTVESGSKWSWDGNKELPTLTPSVHSTGCCGWHGWLKKGKWTNAN